MLSSELNVKNLTVHIYLVAILYIRYNLIKTFATCFLYYFSLRYVNLSKNSFFCRSRRCFSESECKGTAFFSIPQTFSRKISKNRDIFRISLQNRPVCAHKSPFLGKKTSILRIYEARVPKCHFKHKILSQLSPSPERFPCYHRGSAFSPEAPVTYKFLFS